MGINIESDSEEARVFKRAPSRRTATGEFVPAAILRDGHVQQAARDLLRMRSVACVVSIRSDWFHGIDLLVPEPEVRAHRAAKAIANFGFERGTRITELLVV